MATSAKNHKRIKKEDHPAIHQAVADLIEKFHPTLITARIALVWRYGWRPDKHGSLTLGKCRKASDYDLAFASYDFVILLGFESWVKMDNSQRLALLDHELAHAYGEEKDDGSMNWSIRKHDLEEFREIVERHGMYKSDLEDFIKAGMRQPEPGLLDDITDPEDETDKPKILPLFKKKKKESD